MNARLQVAILPGGRLHLNDGPIDLVIEAGEWAKSVNLQPKARFT